MFLPDRIESAFESFSNFMWGIPLVLLLLGGGAFFLIYSGLVPFRYFRHAIQVIRGKFDKKDDPGQINHFQALSTALASTIGMGNISGVAIAIATGGPGAIFWMWMSAFFGIATKYHTCSLAVMYRQKDEEGELQGGPMYVITKGLGRNWRPLAIIFSLAGMIGVLPLFQVNQFNQALQDIVLTPFGIAGNWVNYAIGIMLTGIAGFVIFGGIKRLGKISGKLVPIMVSIYFLSVIFILLTNPGQIIPSFGLIIKDAFTGQAVLGGALGTLILTGVRRGTFSNEAGLGTAPMAHAAAKTNEPIREGLVAMMGPAIDTLVVCTLTALALIITGSWVDTSVDGITMTAMAFEKGIPILGKEILMLCVTIFAFTTLFAYPYYGTKCFTFVFGAKQKSIYRIIYLGAIFLATVASMDAVINLVESHIPVLCILKLFIHE
ncbi:alanine/glycine:cation symporter family protein, partial [Bacteroidota bacterium]